MGGVDREGGGGGEGIEEGELESGKEREGWSTDAIPPYVGATRHRPSVKPLGGGSSSTGPWRRRCVVSDPDRSGANASQLLSISTRLLGLTRHAIQVIYHRVRQRTDQSI